MRTEAQRSRLPSLLLLLAVASAALGEAAASPRPAEVQPSAHYRVQTWTTDDGLPQNTVNALAQTLDGYLWIGTVFGLVRFDGARFATFDEKNTPELQSHTIESLHAARNGALWIGTRNGLVRLHEGIFTRFGEEQGLPDNRVFDVTGSGSEEVWVLSHNDGNAISRFRDGQFDHFSAPGSEEWSAYSIYLDRQGRLWVARPWEVLILNPETGETAGVSEVFKTARLGARSIVQDDQNHFWFGQEGGVCQASEASVRFIPFPGNLSEEIAEHLTWGGQGELWVSTARGPLRFFKETWTYYPHEEDPPRSNLSPVLEDREGNLWFGTRVWGLHRLRLGKLRAYAKEHGLVHDSAWSVCESRNGGLWIGTGGGLSRWRDGTFLNFTQANGVPRGYITTVCETREGELYFGMRTGNPNDASGAAFLCAYRNGHFHPLFPPGFEELNRVWVTYEDSKSRLWIGTSQGLFRAEKGEYSRYTTEHGLSHHDVRAVAEDAEGGLWIGTNGGGLNHLKQGKFTSYSVPEGLSNPNAWSIHIDDDGVLWIGTEYGLNRLKDGQFTQYYQDQGLFDDLVNHILEDDFGNLWISCNRGIYRVRKQDLHDVADGQLDRAGHVAYGTADGMLINETNGECQPAGCKTEEGKLVFPTGKGIVIINPREVLGSSAPPPVVIEEIAANGRVIDSREPGGPSAISEEQPNLNDSLVQLAAGSGNVLRFQYTASSLTDPAKVRFKYRLRGHHQDWIDAGPRRSALYTNLRPGQYEFQVIAANHHGVWNEAGAVLAFVLAPHFYQTKTFVAAITTGLTGLLFALHRFILIQRMKWARLQQQVALNQERSRIAQDMHDELGSRLTEIAMLGELAGRLQDPSQAATRSVEKMKRRSRELIESMDEMVWVTNPKHDTLESLVAYLSQHAQNFLGMAGLQCHLEMPLPEELPERPLPSEFRHHLFLMLKESLVNILKHASAREAVIQFRLDADSLSLTVKDDGRGISDLDRRPFGNGLINMKQRAERLRGTCEVAPNQPAGTEVRIRVPLP